MMPSSVALTIKNPLPRALAYICALPARYRPGHVPQPVIRQSPAPMSDPMPECAYACTRTAATQNRRPTRLDALALSVGRHGIAAVDGPVRCSGVW